MTTPLADQHMAEAERRRRAGDDTPLHWSSGLDHLPDLREHAERSTPT